MNLCDVCWSENESCKLSRWLFYSCYSEICAVRTKHELRKHVKGIGDIWMPESSFHFIIFCNYSPASRVPAMFADLHIVADRSPVYLVNNSFPLFTERILLVEQNVGVLHEVIGMHRSHLNNMQNYLDQLLFLFESSPNSVTTKEIWIVGKCFVGKWKQNVRNRTAQSQQCSHQGV